MIDLKNYEIFNRHMSNLKETSLDSRDGMPGRYMTDSPLAAVNFDDVKEEYVQGLELCETPRSNDALFDDGNGALVFVEFKNGLITRAKQFAIRKKIYDSVLMFSDITSSKISDTRNIMNYILVYNESANAANQGDPELLEKQRKVVQPSPSFDSIAKTISGYAKKEYICFGLKIFKHYCFKEVHTFTEAEFDSYLAGLQH